jgi:hypothetical protein
MNNDNGVGGILTPYGTYICQDYDNTPAPLTGGTWTGDSYSRYSKTTITQAQALAISAATTSGNVIDFSLVAGMTTYGGVCDSITTPHSNITWVRLSKSDGTVIYNGCPIGNFTSVDVCTPATTTTTSTSTSTTTTTSTTTATPTTTTTSTTTETPTTTTTSTTTEPPPTTTTTTTLPPCDCHDGTINDNDAFFYYDCDGNVFTGGNELGTEICYDINKPYSGNITDNGPSVFCSCTPT